MDLRVVAQLMSARELEWTVSGRNITVRIEGSQFSADDRTVPFRLVAPGLIEISGRLHRFHVLHNGRSCSVWLDGRAYHFILTDKTNLTPTTAAPGIVEITALMPGKILRIEVSLGDMVSEKQPVAFMESMKMESPLRAPKSGRVSRIHCQPGQAVEMGELLMVIE